MKQYKLVSTKGTLLGTITVPDEWFNSINRYQIVRAAVVAPISPKYLTKGSTHLVADKAVTLRKARWCGMTDALCLTEGTIEELELMPECHFSPSMAYIKSQLTQKD